MLRRTAMLRRTENRGADRAFTLVELLIVILLIAILMAIIIPQFFGARQKAGDRVAQQTLRTAVTTAKTFAQDNESFASVTPATLATQEGNVQWVGGTTASSKAQVNTNTSGSNKVSGNQRTVSVYVDPSNDQNLTLAALGENNACWFVRLHYGADASGNSIPDQYGLATNSAASCTGSAMSTASGNSVTVNNGEFPGRN